MAYHIDDFILNLKLTYSRALVDVMEQSLRSHLSSVRAKRLRRYQKDFWKHEAIRTVRYALFIRYYALFEAHLRQICDRHTEQDRLRLRLKDIAGKSFLDSVAKFYSRVLHDHPLSNHVSWPDINQYAVLRNLIIHADGQISDVHTVSTEFREWVSNTSSLHIDRHQQVCMRKPFCYRAITHMAAFLLQAGHHEIAPNQASDATSEPAPGVASSVHQGERSVKSK